MECLFDWIHWSLSRKRAVEFYVTQFAHIWLQCNSDTKLQSMHWRKHLKSCLQYLWCNCFYVHRKRLINWSSKTSCTVWQLVAHAKRVIKRMKALILNFWFLLTLANVWQLLVPNVMPCIILDLVLYSWERPHHVVWKVYGLNVWSSSLIMKKLNFDQTKCYCYLVRYTDTY